MELIEQAAAVAAVLVLLAATLWWMKRRGLAAVAGRRRTGRRIEAVERLALGPQHGLCLVRVGGRGILVGLSPAGCSVLESGEWSRFETAPGELRP